MLDHFDHIMITLRYFWRCIFNDTQTEMQKTEFIEAVTSQFLNSMP